MISLAKLVSLTNVGIYIWAVYEALSNGKWKPLIHLWITTIVVAIMKELLRAPRPKDAKACDAFAIAGKATSFGMPSGHVATAVVGWLYLARATSIPEWVVALFATILMGWSRVQLKCHTIGQSVFGGLVGWVIYHYTI